MLVCLLLALVVSSASGATSANDRQQLLDCHNKLRAQLALGKVPGQPAAADMTVMDYDILIEDRAIFWSEKCIVRHNPKRNRLVKRKEYHRFSWIGQTIAGFSKKAITRACELWWNENEDYDFERNESKNGKMVGHYTQMAAARSTLLGCGIQPCRIMSTNTKHVVCNYAPGGNFMLQQPYKVGAACSQCPKGYDYCLDGALCARKDQCKHGNCSCVLKCENGAFLNRSSCKCKCKQGFFGVKCQKKCADNCAHSIIDCSDSFWQRRCPKKCNSCVNKVNIFITRHSAGIVVRIRADENL